MSQKGGQEVRHSCDMFVTSTNITSIPVRISTLNIRMLTCWCALGNIYVNHWESPTSMISFENKNFRGGFDVKQQIWDAVKPIIEEWTGKKVVQTSLYGIRLYHDKAVLSPHVDRLPLVSSAIIQVDQDVDEDWPVEVPILYYELYAIILCLVNQCNMIMIHNYIWIINF